MLSLPPGLRIFVAVDPVDMRKSFDGLAAIIQHQLQLDPLAGHLVLFTNRRRDLLKIFFFDRSGYTIIFRRLEQGTFQFPSGESRVQIDVAELAMILEGIDLRSVVRRKRYVRPLGAHAES